MQPTKRPWHDYSGRLSLLKTMVFIGLFIPGLLTAYGLATNQLGARPITEAIHEVGDWTIRFIFLALAVTPLSRALRWNRLNLVRRMVGVAAFVYIMAHFVLYIVDEGYKLGVVASEIVLRFYLVIGFIALIGLAVLAATSTDGMIKRLGPKRWQNLHRWVYVIAILALWHYFLQSKSNEWQPTIMFGFLFWLFGWRLIAWMRKAKPVPLWALALLGVISGIVTGAFEIGYYHFASHVPVERVLMAQYSLAPGTRPAWVVLAVTLAVALVAAFAAFFRPRSQPAKPA